MLRLKTEFEVAPRLRSWGLQSFALSSGCIKASQQTRRRPAPVEQRSPTTSSTSSDILDESAETRAVITDGHSQTNVASSRSVAVDWRLLVSPLTGFDGEESRWGSG